MSSLRLRDGNELCYRDSGSGEPLLLLHGFTGSNNAWGEGLLSKLSENLRVIAPDLLGHGKSSGPTEPKRYSLEMQTEDLCELLNALGISRASWLGYSMGGRLALAAARRVPDRIANLILIGASPGLRRAAERTGRRHMDDARACDLERLGIVPFVDEWMKNPLFAHEAALGPQHIAAQRERRLANDPFALAASLRGAGTGSQKNLWPELPDLNLRSLLITGEFDEKFCRVAEQMRERLPNARHTIVGAAGHAVHLERPESFADCVLGFLQRAKR